MNTALKKKIDKNHWNHFRATRFNCMRIIHSKKQSAQNING